MEKTQSYYLPAIMLGLGAGILTGFAQSPVANGVISALIAASFLMLSLAPDAAKIKPSGKQISSVTLFVISLIIGAGGGLYLRSNSTIFPSPMQIDFTQLTSLGVSEENARSAILEKYSGGSVVGTTTGINAAPMIFQPTELQNIINANFIIQSVLNAEGTQIEDPKLFEIRSQSTRIAFQLRSLLEREVSQESALLWYRLHTVLPNEAQALDEKLRVEEPEAYQALINFLNTRN